VEGHRGKGARGRRRTDARVGVCFAELSVRVRLCHGIGLNSQTAVKRKKMTFFLHVRPLHEKTMEKVHVAAKYNAHLIK